MNKENILNKVWEEETQVPERNKPDKASQSLLVEPDELIKKKHIIIHR
jgi:hypothetical protein